MTVAANVRTTVVVPTVGRPSLEVLLDRLTAPAEETIPIVVVDDRPAPDTGLLDPTMLGQADIRVARSGGRGPAAARNLGWRVARTPWVSFLDDDVVPQDGWLSHLRHDLETAGADVVGIQGRVSVPLPEHRRPNDWERGTAGLESALWITADMTYRRSALAAVGGFDERFPRAYREDADLALRVLARGGRLERGTRGVNHPVRRADAWISLRVQAGNADDVLMRRLHGRSWRHRASAPSGRRVRHIATTVAAVASAALGAIGYRRAAALAATGWVAATTELAAARILPGPRDAGEVTRMLATSLAIPPAATWHALRGLWQHRSATPWRGLPDLVLFDRDGTLVRDEPYNGDPDRVVAAEGAGVALASLRERGIRVGVVSNQSGIARGWLTPEDVEAVNARVEELLGPFDAWQVCPHGPEDGCACRKPEPGMVKKACAELDVAPDRCVVVGDIGSDVAAARAAGAAAVLVPTPATLPEEIALAPAIEPNLRGAARRILDGDW
jgi:HAD superfamily hydrolase (TIGR01662 family)